MGASLLKRNLLFLLGLVGPYLFSDAGDRIHMWVWCVIGSTTSLHVDWVFMVCRWINIVNNRRMTTFYMFWISVSGCAKLWGGDWSCGVDGLDDYFDSLGGYFLLFFACVVCMASCAYIYICTSASKWWYFWIGSCFNVGVDTEVLFPFDVDVGGRTSGHLFWCSLYPHTR